MRTWPTILALTIVPTTLQAQTPVSVTQALSTLPIENESQCSPYNRDRDYPYSQSLEDSIIERLGNVFGPYTKRFFPSARMTEIEHIVAAREAHDSGLCRQDRAEDRPGFASDMENLTLAGTALNQVKFDRDADTWLPYYNRCWFAERTIAVKAKYRLSVDADEHRALASIVEQCDSYQLDMSPGGDRPMVLQQYDDNDDWSITCSEARRHGIAPVRRGDAAYYFVRDPDEDGIACR